MANNSTFEQLKSNFNELANYAQSLKASIVDYEPNEEWMIENGLLVNEELKIYIGKNIVLLGKLLNTIEESLINDV